MEKSQLRAGPKRLSASASFHFTLGACIGSEKGNQQRPSELHSSRTSHLFRVMNRATTDKHLKFHQNGETWQEKAGKNQLLDVPSSSWTEKELYRFSRITKCQWQQTNGGSQRDSPSASVSFPRENMQRELKTFRPNAIKT
jgi:hypothetical protein